MILQVEKRMQLGPDDNGIPLAPWEFDSGEFDEGWRYELLNGMLIVSPSPLLEVRDPNDELGRWLRNYREDNLRGGALDLTVPEHTIVIGPHRRRVDRALWIGLGRIPAAIETPTIVVEFVSKGRRNRDRDYEAKRDDYHEVGIREYWIIDRFIRQMLVYRFDRGRMTEKIIRERATYSTPLLPGFKMPLAKLLALADRWKDA